MPRKHRTPASSSLNRENQRRSRARHREFVQDLQTRLLEYERRGVHASVELQKVARAVAQENTALRGLLAAHGVPQDEINACAVPMESLNEVSTEKDLYGPNGHNPPPPGLSDQAEASPFRPALSNPSPGSRTADSITVKVAPATEQTDATTSDHEVNQCCTRETSCTCTMELETDSTASHMPHLGPNCYNPPEPPRKSPRPLTSTLEMPCEEAATILAQLRGQPDSTLARGALGCHGTNSCFVKNTELLQLMDEAA